MARVPTAAAELAPLHQLARATWSAVTARDEAEARGASVADIRRWWQSASGYFGPLAMQYAEKIAEAKRSGGEVPKAFTRGLWKKVRGPMGAAALTAARVGWRLGDPFHVYDQDGTDFLLTNTSPALVRKLACDALRTSIERKVATKWAVEEEQYRGRRACLDFVTTAVKTCKHLSPHQRGIMRAVTCGALMTGCRAVKMGYLVTGLCPLCGMASDTLTHRVYECTHTAAAVAAAVPSWFLDEAKRKAAGDSFWTTGACPSPVDLAPPPVNDLRVEVETLDEGTRASDGEDIMAIRGRAYWDGSATTSVVKGLTRAACAVVQTDEEGRPMKILQAAVPRHLPQTAQAAEFMGLGIVFKALRARTSVVGDCLNVVRAANGLARNALAQGHMYAGLTLSTYEQPERRRWAGEIAWTRAHRKPTGRESADELRDMKGNEAADAAAKDALLAHPALGTNVESQVIFYERRVRHVVDAVVAALQLFPRAPGNMPRAPRPLTEQQARQRRMHHWAYRGGSWRCTFCDDWLNSDQIPRARKFQRCHGLTMADRASAIAARGHDLFRAAADVQFVYCAKCGAWGHKRVHLLAGSCAPPKAAGIQALRRIRRGEHPLQRRGPKGILLPREHVRTVARYDRQEARWVDTGGGTTGTTLGAPEGCWRHCGHDHGYGSVQSDGARDGVMNSDGEAREEQHVDVAFMDSNGGQEGCDEMLIFDDAADDDVFGHGGSLDQESEARPRDGAIGSPSDFVPAGSTSANARSQLRGAKSIWERSSTGTAEAAIGRLKINARPPSTDATERILAVRRRVRQRLISGGGEADGEDKLNDAEAKGAVTSVDAARVGPGGPHRCRATDAVTTPGPGSVVAGTVAVGGAATELLLWRQTREAAADRGEVADSPPCESAVSQDGIEDTESNPTGRDDVRTLQAEPRRDGGGGPPKRRRLQSPQEPPKRLGVGPSMKGREEIVHHGGRPASQEIVRRRVGSIDHGSLHAAACDSGGAAATGFPKRPLKGLCLRVPRARQYECASASPSPSSLRTARTGDIASSGGGEAAGTGQGCSPVARNFSAARGWTAKEEHLDGPATVELEERSGGGACIPSLHQRRRPHGADQNVQFDRHAAVGADDRPQPEVGDAMLERERATTSNQPRLASVDGAATERGDVKGVTDGPTFDDQAEGTAGWGEARQARASTSGEPRPGRRCRHSMGSSTSDAPQPRLCRPHGRGGSGAQCSPTENSFEVCPSFDNGEGDNLSSDRDSPPRPLFPAVDARDALPAALARDRGRAQRSGPLAVGGRRGGQDAARGAVGDGGLACFSAMGDGHCDTSHGSQAKAQTSFREPGSTDSGGGGPSRDEHFVVRNCPGSDVSLERRVLCVHTSGVTSGGSTSSAWTPGASSTGAGATSGPRRTDPGCLGFRLDGELASRFDGSSGDRVRSGPAAAEELDYGGAEYVVKRRRLRGKQPVGDKLGGNSMHAEFSGGPSCSTTLTPQCRPVSEHDGPLLTVGSADASNCGGATAGHQGARGGFGACWPSRGGRPPDAVK